ncbi:MAG: Spy/CpxP family protein refolding chaperone [Bacteroidota bacterium]|nr:Spy/CpxP family protein refolding chaperone [Bacteroidota bacterium]MDP4190330.1 Spy/CpxP family protein refolding chaperone [Bacteroidota bacterium]MDP4193542.1 Spy/CpxP family protein refolding chaperone [Bacteroidota bacterium]
MKQITSFLSVLILTGIFNFTGAQPLPPQNNQEQLRHLKKELKLDDNQTEKLKAIFKDSRAKMKELRDKMEASREKDMEQMDKILDDQDKQIEKILNDTQKEKFNQIKDDRPMPPLGLGPQGQMKGGPGEDERFQRMQKHGPNFPGNDPCDSSMKKPGNPVGDGEGNK